MAFFNPFSKKAEPQPQENLPPGLSHVTHIIAVASGKGGVGKSTLTTNLAYALKDKGYSVGLLDADIYGPSQPQMLGAEMEKASNTGQALIPIQFNGISFISMASLMSHDGPVVWRAPMAMKVMHQFLQQTMWGKLDFLLIDLPPGTGDVQLTLAQQAELSGAVIVTTPQEMALNISLKGLKMFEQVNVPILGIIENMSGFVCSHCDHETAIFKSGGGIKLAEKTDVPFLGKLPLDPHLMDCTDQGKAFVKAFPNSHTAKCLNDIVVNLENNLQILSQGGKFLRPLKVEIKNPSALELKWSETESVSLSAFDLRNHCGCAFCIDENTGKKILDSSKIKSDIQLKGFAPIGRYALSMSFSDGHNTGIYPFEKLLELSQQAVQAGTTQSTVTAKAPSGASFGASASSAASSALSLEAIKKVLDEKINPMVAGHGGNIQAVSLDQGVLSIRMEGGCQGCAASQVTLKQGVEKTLFTEFPGLKEVRDVTSHKEGTKPFYQSL